MTEIFDYQEGKVSTRIAVFGDCHVGQGLLRNRHCSRRIVALPRRWVAASSPQALFTTGRGSRLRSTHAETSDLSFVDTFHEPMKEQAIRTVMAMVRLDLFCRIARRMPLQTCLIGSDHAP